MKKRRLLISSVVIVLLVLAGGLYRYQAAKAQKKEQFERLLSYIDTRQEEKAEKWLQDIKDPTFINKVSDKGCTPLECALRMQLYSLSKTLLEKGADVSPKADNPLFIELAYSLDHALQMQDEEKQKAKNEMFNAALKKAENKLMEENEDGNTALHIVSLKGDSQLVELFLKHGANPRSKNKAGETPLVLAVQEGNIEASLALMNHDKELTKIKDKEGNTLLTIAVIAGRTELVKKLTRMASIPVDDRNQLGKTALMYASEYGEKEQVQLLLDAKADKSLKSNEGKTAHDYAKEWKHKGVMKLLK
ncbi:ankyrin repeat domain-containing protein [Peribacillus sp. NPDC097295]|uniref:ankyrin repeat domain-containing protein n=1 Tax=Peribacillus sp. NPDC097295 TaxID=3364402 RepID=UPI0038274E58